MCQRRAGASIQTAGSSSQTSMKTPMYSITIAINHCHQNQGRFHMEPVAE